MAVASTTNATSVTTKKARPKTITQKGPGIFVECGKVRLGKAGEWSELTGTGLNRFRSEPPQIGLWGIVKNGNKPLKEIAEQVYGDAKKAIFIADANRIVGAIARKDQQLFIPNLTYNRLKEQNEYVNSNYYFTFADISKFKPIMQIAGDVYIPSGQAYVKQYYYMGPDHNSKLVATETLTFKEFYQGLVMSTQCLADIKTDTWAPVVKDGSTAIKNKKELSKFKIRKTDGRLQFRIDKELKSLDIKPTYGRWIGYTDFAKRMFKGAFSKGAVIFSLVIAGIKAWLDWEKNKNWKHALWTLGKEAIKAGISTAAGVGAAILVTVLFVPGPGWVVATVIVASAVAGLILDNLDDGAEKAGYQKWAY